MIRRGDAPRRELAERLREARAFTRRLTDDLGDAEARSQFDPGFSPIGWHLGHVAWQEERWVLRRRRGHAPIDPALDVLYDSFTSAKESRGIRLPPIAAIRAYAEAVRERVLEALEADELDAAGGWTYRFLAGHELQHGETIAVVRLLGRLPLPGARGTAEAEDEGGWDHFLDVPGGRYLVGWDGPEGWDNERPAHVVELGPFAIARRPVTNGAWLDFIAAGGYRDDRLWSEAGRRWREAHSVDAPLHWRHGAGGWERFTLAGWRPLSAAHPVSHVSFFEAEAFAAWAGARLPAEAEWERAAAGSEKRRWPWGDEPRAGAPLFLRTGDTAPPTAAGASPVGAEEMAGNVWEWTASHFLPWPGFAPDPYRGYSEPWFGDGHRVLRGGSWISHPEMARTTFRNWFEPGVRAFPSGLRLARRGG